MPWASIVAIVAALALLVGAGALVVSGMTRESGKLSAASAYYDFGQVAYKGGLITTRFPLSVEGDTRVTDITTT